MNYEFIKEIHTQHTGGHIYNDVIILKDGQVIRISDEMVVVFNDIKADEDNEEVGHVYFGGKIRDMRGELFSANYLLIENGRLYYCGMPVKKIQKDDFGNSKYYYYIMVNDKDAIAMIALSDEDYQLATKYLQS